MTAPQIPGLTSDLGVDNPLRRTLLSSANILAAVGGVAQGAVVGESAWNAWVNPVGSKRLMVLVDHDVKLSAAGLVDYRDATPAQVVATLNGSTQALSFYLDRARFGLYGGGNAVTAGQLYFGHDIIVPGFTRSSAYSEHGSLLAATGRGYVVLKPDTAIVVSSQSLNVAGYTMWSWLELPLSADAQHTSEIVAALRDLAHNNR